MNEEKKIAEAIMDAIKMHEESYCRSIEESIGEYKLQMEECLIISCKKHELSPNLWALLNLAMHWINDIQLWCVDILADKTVGPCCDTPSKDLGLASPLNQG